MLVPLDCLKPGDTFLDLYTDTVYKVVSEAVERKILCVDDEGFSEMFDEIRLVRPIERPIADEIRDGLTQINQRLTDLGQ